MAVTSVSGKSSTVLQYTTPTTSPAPVCHTVEKRIETPDTEVEQTIKTCVQRKTPTAVSAADARNITAAAEKVRQSQLVQKAGQQNVEQNSYPAAPAGKTTPYGFQSADVGNAQELLNKYYQAPVTPTSESPEGAAKTAKYKPLAKDECLGPKTREQLLAYQKAHNLAGGGDLTPETLASLKQTAGKGMTVGTDPATQLSSSPRKVEEVATDANSVSPQKKLETPEKRAQASKLLGDTLNEWKKDSASPELVSSLGTLKDQLDAGKIGVGPALQQFRGLNGARANQAIDRAHREAEAWQIAANVTHVVRDGSVVLAGALAAPVLGVPGALASFGTAAAAGTTFSVGSSALSAASAPEAQRARFLSEVQDPTKHLTLGFLSGLGTLTMPTEITPLGPSLPSGGGVLRPQLPGGTPPRLPSSNLRDFSGATIEVPHVVVK